MYFNHTQYDQHYVIGHTNSAICNFVPQQILICRSCEVLWWQLNDWHCNWLICVSSNYPIPGVPINRNDICIRDNIFFFSLTTLSTQQLQISTNVTGLSNIHYPNVAAKSQIKLRILTGTTFSKTVSKY